MPDQNKLEALRESHAQAARCCGTCSHGMFGYSSPWGICYHPDNSYRHKKHDRIHKGPANSFMVCNHYDLDEEKLEMWFGEYSQYMKPDRV